MKKEELKYKTRFRYSELEEKEGMSEFTELISEGILCQTCGECLDDIADESDAPGYPRNCMDCDEEYSNS